LLSSSFALSFKNGWRKSETLPNTFLILSRWGNLCLAPEANLFGSETCSDSYAATIQWARQLSAGRAPVPAGSMERKAGTKAARSQVLPHPFCSSSTAGLRHATGLPGPASCF